MTAYQIAGYLHLVAGIGLFVALGLEWLLLVRLRDAETTDRARSWLSLTAYQRPIGLASLVTVLFAGLYMAVTAWGAVGWISTTVIALLLMMGFGAFNGLRLAPLEQALRNEHGPRTSGQLAQTRNRLLLVSKRGPRRAARAGGGRRPDRNVDRV
jgi:hypothetical protein